MSTVRLGVRRLMMSVEDGQTSDPRKTLMTNITYGKLSELRSNEIIAGMVLTKKEKFIAKDLQNSEICAEVISPFVEVI